VHFLGLEAGMRTWFFFGVGLFAMSVVLTLLQGREDEEMFIRLGNRDLRSLPV
jgi:type IV secretory pathway TrbD component